jgi:hypothetical protein
LTRGKPALQASLDVEFPKEFYVGAFIATRIRMPGPPDLEWISGPAVTGASRRISRARALSQYTYPDDPRRVSYNRTELTGTLGFRNQCSSRLSIHPTRRRRISAGICEGDAWAVELSGRQPLDERFSVSAGSATTASTRSITRLQLLERDADGRSHRSSCSSPISVAHAGRALSTPIVGDRVAVTALWRFLGHAR